MKIGLRTTKTAIAAVLSMIVANYLNLLYAPSAGVIAILSVGNTKRSSLYTGIGRLTSLVIATVISFFCFTLVGYNPYAFGLFLLLFIPISARLSLTDGIVVNSVLVTHYMLEESYAFPLLKNEFLLMIIGVGFALLFNLYMPNLEKKLNQDQEKIETAIRDILSDLSNYLNRPSDDKLKLKCEGVLHFIREGQQQAQVYQDNQWQRENLYYEAYFSMRRSQVLMLVDMVKLLSGIQVEEILVEDLRILLDYTADTFAEENDGKEILKRINCVYDVYREKNLPKDRQEFENRARLFQFLQSFKSFIEIKAEFYETNSHVKLNHSMNGF